ncbi:hypothetical protein CLAIMM_13780 [Cladophialophora immunda]|nr:hypothetical protein CLAIMM_13780 [Cladophialophora immunda]
MGTEERQKASYWRSPYSISSIRIKARAQVAKREAQAKKKQIPPFVQKLNSFLEDGRNTHLIRELINSVLQLGLDLLLGFTDIVQSYMADESGLRQSYKNTSWFGVLTVPQARL